MVEDEKKHRTKDGGKTKQYLRQRPFSHSCMVRAQFALTQLAFGFGWSVFQWETAVKLPTQKTRTTGMDDVEWIVFLILGMWLFGTAKRQICEKRPNAARQGTVETNCSVQMKRLQLKGVS